MSNHVKKTKRTTSTPARDKKRASEPAAPTNPEMMATVFEPINADVRPAESKKKTKKTKSRIKEDKTQERTVEREDQDRVQAQHLPVRDGSKEVTRKNADMKSGTRKKKPRDTDDTEERISEKAAVAESPTGTPETQRPVISKSLKIGKTSYKIVYSTSHGRQIPRFVPEPTSDVTKPTGGDEKTAMEHNNGGSNPTPECP